MNNRAIGSIIGLGIANALLCLALLVTMSHLGQLDDRVLKLEQKVDDTEQELDSLKRQ